MLALRPNCECCDIDLPAHSDQAYICSYECTFCRSCAFEVLSNVCPNCGGGFSPRPIRPSHEHRPGISVHHQLPSPQRVINQRSPADIEQFTEKLKHLAPGER